MRIMNRESINTAVFRDGQPNDLHQVITLGLRGLNLAKLNRLICQKGRQRPNNQEDDVYPIQQYPRTDDGKRRPVKPTSEDVADIAEKMKKAGARSEEIATEIGRHRH